MLSTRSAFRHSQDSSSLSSSVFSNLLQSSSVFSNLLQPSLADGRDMQVVGGPRGTTSNKISLSDSEFNFIQFPISNLRLPIIILNLQFLLVQIWYCTVSGGIISAYHISISAYFPSVGSSWSRGVILEYFKLLLVLRVGSYLVRILK